MWSCAEDTVGEAGDRAKALGGGVQVGRIPGLT